MMPTAQGVADFLGQGDDTDVVALAGSHLPIVLEAVKAYTRGGGFDETGALPDTDVEAVIVSATARSVRNPSQDTWQRAGSFSHRPGIFDGWTLAELAILHRHRRRAL